MDRHRRYELHEELVALAGSSFRVYYQPPTGTHINYPCIIYERDGGLSVYADDMSYSYTQRYTVTVITRDPDCELPYVILEHFKMCRVDRTFVNDNLYHDVLTVYY